MTFETWMSTGTLLSLKAVEMKHPKVKAAMTLREKANKEFALERTVFIFKQLREVQGISVNPRDTYLLGTSER